MKLKTINIFIASPSDVADARNLVKKAINHVNKLLAREFGFLFEPIGWEQIPPGKGSRPQTLINPYVESAQIFIGILFQRFGTSTGLAESGTEEEYNLIEKIWHERKQKPTIWMYFKKVPSDRLSDPGSQLKKVVQFKKRIQKTDFYHEFENDEDIETNIEDALADWIKKNHKRFRTSKINKINRELINEPSLKFLAQLIQKGEIKNTKKYQKNIRILAKNGLIKYGIGEKFIEPSNSAESFIKVSQLLNSNMFRKILFESSYFSSMLKIHLKSLILSRQHCQLTDDEINVLLKILSLSPSALTYTLHGDTSIYDNLLEHVKSMGKNNQDFANSISWESLLSNVLLLYANDLINSKLLYKIEQQEIVANLITIKIGASYENAIAFRALSKFPIIRLRTKEKLKKGQLVAFPAERYVQNGNIFMQLGEPDFALEQYDKALSKNISDEARVVALNNKGFLFLNMGKKEEAAELFKLALNINADLPQARQNLELCNK